MERKLPYDFVKNLEFAVNVCSYVFPERPLSDFEPVIKDAKHWLMMSHSLSWVVPEEHYEVLEWLINKVILVKQISARRK